MSKTSKTKSKGRATETSQNESEDEGEESEEGTTLQEKSKNVTPLPDVDGNQIEKTKIQNEIKALQAKTDDQLFEEILEFIECHDQAAYRKKIKGYRLAFNIRDKQHRIPESLMKKEAKQRSKESAEEIKQKVQEMKERRINELRTKEQEEKNKQERNRVFFK